MKYSAVIPFLDAELRNEEAWPDATTKVDEQINLLYIAALSVYKEIPLLRTTVLIVESASLATTTFGSNSQLKRVTLPETIFDLRPDYGIATYRLDNVDFTIDQAVSKDSILSIGDNKTHTGNTLFALDQDNNQLYVANVADVKLFHVPIFTKPTNDDDVNTDYENLDWPLKPGTDTQRAIHVVAAHISGSTIRDSANAQFQALLQEVYR